MTKRMTRRELLRDAGAAGATTLLAVGSGKAITPADPLNQAAGAESPAPELPQSAGVAKSVFRASQAPLGPHENALVELTAGDMIVALDRRYGSISSITRKGDPLGTNFIGNGSNTSGVDVANSRWTGDIVTAVWDVTDPNPAHRQWSPRVEFRSQGKVEAGADWKVRRYPAGELRRWDVCSELRRCVDE